MTTLGPVTETAQTERSLILVKPDGFRRGLTGEVIRRIEAKGYTLAALSVLTASREQLAAHYAEHEGKPFYEPLVEFMSSGPVPCTSSTSGAFPVVLGRSSSAFAGVRPSCNVRGRLTVAVWPPASAEPRSHRVSEGIRCCLMPSA